MNVRCLLFLIFLGWFGGAYGKDIFTPKERELIAHYSSAGYTVEQRIKERQMEVRKLLVQIGQLYRVELRQELQARFKGKDHPIDQYFERFEQMLNERIIKRIIHERRQP